jgi:large subunit ribosomal protein L32
VSSRRVFSFFNGHCASLNDHRGLVLKSRLTKKFTRLPNSLLTKYATPKTNIITCLDCGAYHEKGTLCGECYRKVKEETKALQDAMFKKSEHFRDAYPAKEIAFAYENDDKEEVIKQSNGRVIVEVPKKRPTWFSNNLLTKVSSRIGSKTDDTNKES